MKAVLVYSGGLDSTTLLYDYRADIALAVSFDYGSRHNAREIAFAREHCRELGIPHLVIPLDFIGRYFRSSLLLSGDSIPEGSYAEDNMRSTVVPFRNGIMLAIAAGLAESRDLDTVLIANHSGDHAIYPDCRPAFIDAFDAATAAGTYNGVRIVSPYCRLTKREIALGQERGLDMTEARYRLGAQQKRLREHCAMTGLPRDGERERAYGVKAQPRALSAKHVPSPSEDRSILRVDNVSEHKFVKGSGSYATEIVTDAQRITLKSGQTLYVAKGTPVDYRNDLIKQFRKLPKTLKDTVRTIDVLNIENPDDVFFRQAFARFTRSDATGGDGKITVYSPGLACRGGDLLGLLAHEAGHCFDDVWHAEHGEDLSWSQAWLNAMKEDEARTGNTFITSYAERAFRGGSRMREDLADSARWLVRSRNGFSIEVETKDGKMPIEEAYASRMNLLREVLKYGDKS